MRWLLVGVVDVLVEAFVVLPFFFLAFSV